MGRFRAPQLEISRETNFQPSAGAFHGRDAFPIVEHTHFDTKIRDDGSMVLALTHALATPQPMSKTTPYQAAVVYNHLGDYLDNTIVPAFSQELQAVLRDALTSSIHKGKIRLMTKENTQTGTSTGAFYESVPWLTTQANRIRKSNDVAVTYWTSSYKTENGVPKFYVIDTDGSVKSEAVHPVNTHSVVFLIDV